MTSSRVVRGTKGRIIVCVCAVLIIIGIIACYNNTLSQLDSERKANNQCHQQQENLSTQLQVIFDYKQRLEKSLKTEKVDHQQCKKDTDEQRQQHEKALSEASAKFSSLQQHYNLLQTQNEDFKSECSKIQQQQLDQSNNLQNRLKEVQTHLQQKIDNKTKIFENLKSSYLNLQIENSKLQNQIKGTHSDDQHFESERNHLTKLNNELRRELDALKSKCSTFLGHENAYDSEKNVSKSGNDVNDRKQDISNVGDNPNKKDLDNLENNNNDENVIAAPGEDKLQVVAPKSSTATNNSTLKGSLRAAEPLNIPAVTPNSTNNKPSVKVEVANQNAHVLPLPYLNKKIPDGVVPVPDTPLEPPNDESKDALKKPETEDKEGPRDDVNNAFPNRYRSNLILNEMANEFKAKEAERREERNEVDVDGKQNILKSDVGDKENNAIEVFDAPLNEEKPLESNPFALDDHNGDVVNKKKIESNNAKALGFIESPNKEKRRPYDAHDGDYDKILQNDLQLEENDPEAEDDDPEYADHNMDRQKDPAVRN